MPDSQSEIGSETTRRPIIEYEYIIRVAALDTLNDMMKEEKIPVPQDFGILSFKSSKLLDMRKYYETGLISSYAIIKTLREEEILEEEFRESTRPQSFSSDDSLSPTVGP